MKKYPHLRIRSFELQSRVNIRAAQEGIYAIELVEKALEEYLKKPLKPRKGKSYAAIWGKPDTRS